MGNGYSEDTGDFITAVRVAKLYFFYVHFQVQQGERTKMDIRVNVKRLVQKAEDNGSANGWPWVILHSGCCTRER